MPKTATIEDVLHFWFEEITPEHWFKKDDAFDDSIRTRFEPTIVAALSARLDSWADSADGPCADPCAGSVHPQYLSRYAACVQW